MPDQAEIHRKCASRVIEDRLEAASLLRTNFSNLPYKDQAWKDLIRLTQDEDSNVRWSAADALGSGFVHVLDKDQAWKDLIRLTQNEDNEVRWIASASLGSVFVSLPDKTKGCRDIHKLTQVRDREVRCGAAVSVDSAFNLLPDINQGWQDLLKLTQDKDSKVQEVAASALGSAFIHLIDKTQGWKDLLKFTQHQDSELRLVAAVALDSAFSHLTDKTQGWQDLLKLAKDQDCEVRQFVAETLDSAFALLPNKTQGWLDLVKLTQNGDGVRWVAAAFAVGLAFALLPDKTQGWKDLHKLTLDPDEVVRSGAVEGLRLAFADLPDKILGGQDLHRLTQDGDSGVRWRAANALGTAFAHVPDKDQAWEDLVRLTQDEGIYFVRMYAYHSLGRATIFKATRARDNSTLKRELEAAVVYFEKSSQEWEYGPAMFCHPFYRTYLAVTFQEAKEDEFQRYLAEAKEAVGNSKCKGELLNAVENLAGALKEAQSLKDRPFQEVVSKLNSYRWYCENAANHMAAAEDKAPGTIELMRKCNPLLDDRIRAIIAEIQEKARLISPEIERAARCLSLDDPIKAHQCCIRMASALRDSISRLPKEKSELICDILRDIEKGGDLSLLLGKLELAMAYALPAIETERKEILDRLRNIQFSISNLNISSGSARKDLYELKTSVRNVQDKIASQKLNMEDLGKILKELDQAMLERLENMRDDWLESVEKMAQDLPSCDDKEELLMEIRSLKQSQRRDILGITGDISSIAGLFIGLIGLAAL